MNYTIFNDDCNNQLDKFIFGEWEEIRQAENHDLHRQNGSFGIMIIVGFAKIGITAINVNF